MIGLYQGILSTLIRFCMDKHWPVEATFRYAGYDLTELRIGQVPLSPDQFFWLTRLYGGATPLPDGGTRARPLDAQ
jgi:hypothetical protein